MRASPGSVLGSAVHRVLRPSGQFIFHIQNLLNYMVFLASLAPESLKSLFTRLVEERAEADRFKTHYRLNTVSRIRTLAEEAGFTAEWVKTVSSSGHFRRLAILGPQKAGQRRLSGCAVRAGQAGSDSAQRA
jgi:hypothetical protein